MKTDKNNKIEAFEKEFESCSNCHSFVSQKAEAMEIRVVKFSCGRIVVGDLKAKEFQFYAKCGTEDDKNCPLCGSFLSFDRECGRCEGL